MFFAEQAWLEAGQRFQHCIRAGVIAHGADAPNHSIQGPKRRAYFYAIVVQHAVSHRVAGDSFGNINAYNIVHTVCLGAIKLQIHPKQAIG